MDGNTIIAIGSGISGLLGGLLVLKRELAKIKADKDTEDKADSREQRERIDSNTWKFIEEIKEERRLWQETATKTQQMLVALQGQYQGALERIEVLEKQRIRDEAQIMNLHTQVRQLGGQP